MHPVDLAAGQTLRVDTGCLVALQPSVGYDIQYVGKIKTALFGGEGLFFATLTGPGRVWLQSLPLSRMADRIYKAAPAAARRPPRGGFDPWRTRRTAGRRQQVGDGRVAHKQQSYANHVYRARAWSVTWLVAALAFLVLLFHVYEEPTYVSFALLAVAGVVVVCCVFDPHVCDPPAESHHQARNADPSGSARA